ncbi:DUF1203 domain-containing protein [Planomonospora venezuelensis]|uniref:DUF1203 domain-containing protein n=1 Tax=Planomonospora venezuelensis TaxID=1999 RepID=A0A841DE45_PLAVE|nr:DUF1203 domain-containing protein [Planomonospora venezuelensis]MBB5967739.1 hypothetical protein [Planomonospora venezuelensis]GIN02634.1 hypothetical protein Pve01_42920 [Planomonospora venezuelensis]
MGYQIRAIGPETVRSLLETDDAGRPPRLSVDEAGGSPLRCCLSRARPGERIALVSYAPLRRWAAETGADPGPYDELGPIFLHAGGCPGPGSGPGWPQAHRGPRVLRAYAAAGHILEGRHLAAGADAETALKELLDDPEVAVVHVRAVAFGCFQFEVRRA